MSSRRLRNLLLRWHLPGIVFGSVAASLMMTHIYSTPGHPIRLREQLIGWSYFLAALTLLTPLFLGFLSLWNAATRRFAILESVVIIRLVALVALAAVIAGVLLLSILLGLGLPYQEDVLGILWQSPFEFLKTYMVLFAATSAWAILPRLLFKSRPIEPAN